MVVAFLGEVEVWVATFGQITNLYYGAIFLVRTCVIIKNADHSIRCEPRCGCHSVSTVLWPYTITRFIVLVVFLWECILNSLQGELTACCRAKSGLDL